MKTLDKEIAILYFENLFHSIAKDKAPLHCKECKHLAYLVHSKRNLFQQKNFEDYCEPICDMIGFFCIEYKEICPKITGQKNDDGIFD